MASNLQLSRSPEPVDAINAMGVMMSETDGYPADGHGQQPERTDARRLQSRAFWVVPLWMRWLAKRLASSLLGVAGISVLVFVATQALPSDPARVILGAEATDAAVNTLRAQLGFDRPIAEQYIHWVSAALGGDLGVSIDSHLPVSLLISQKLANSMCLLGLVLGVLIPTAVSLGVFLALRRDSRIDHWMVTLMIGLKAIPSFAIGFGLVLLFSTHVLRVFPAVSLFDPARPWFGQMQFFVLPVITLVLSTLPYLTRLIRGSMIEVMESDFVANATLRGLPRSRIVLKYALPNALLPTIQAIALIASVLLGGVLVVEVVFAYPGIGTALNAAVDIRDVPVIQGIVLYITAGVMLINLTADLASVLLTPKLRTQFLGGH